MPECQPKNGTRGVNFAGMTGSIFRYRKLDQAQKWPGLLRNDWPGLVRNDHLPYWWYTLRCNS